MNLSMTNCDDIVMIDDDMAHLAERKWHVMNTGYVGGYCRDAKRTVLLHRVVMGTPVGRTPVYDHINRNKLDNRRSNLRVVTPSQNALNAGNDEKGVYPLPSGRWRATIRINYKIRHLGVFDTEAEAYAARKSALDAERND